MSKDQGMDSKNNTISPHSLECNLQTVARSTKSAAALFHELLSPA